MEREKLFGMDIVDLSAMTEKYGMPSFTSRQIAGWLYKHGIKSISEMTNLPLRFRESLEENYETGRNEPASLLTSADGTKKYLFSSGNNTWVETAYIPDRNRATVCLSVQSGCRMGCKFCMTGLQGFQGNLSSGEILNQFISIPEHNSLTNIVYMGMGEPLDNREALFKSLDILTSAWGFGWSPRRITVSTVGIVDGVSEYLEQTECHLAVSLHTPFDDERRELMPVQNANPIAEIVETTRQHDMGRQRRISFEYILFKGINDTPGHVKQLARLLNGLRCRINLIRFHAIPGIEFTAPEMHETESFSRMLNQKGLLTTVRASRGEDIMAACGLLSTMKQNRDTACNSGDK